jgi:N6-adenosine-specific RNA methylase IME4
MGDAVERAKLENLEEVIANSQRASAELGAALSGVRAGKLYATVLGFPTFEEYCESRWGIGRIRAYQLISASEVVGRVKNFIHGDLLTVESHARELAKLPAAEQADAWQEIVENAAGDRITAKDVEYVVERRLAEAENRPTPIIRDEPLQGTTDSLESLIEQGHKYGCIYADPPWRYDNRATRSNVEDEYDGTMTVEEICGLPVEQLAADDAHLHLWVTAAFLFDAKTVIESWGFEYRTYAVWCKPQIGIGNYWRKSSELLILGIRGDAKSFAEHDHRDWLEIGRGEHSAKPDRFRGIIERVSPGPRLELFGRKQIADWMVFGNQVREALFPA